MLLAADRTCEHKDDGYSVTRCVHRPGGVAADDSCCIAHALLKHGKACPRTSGGMLRGVGMRALKHQSAGLAAPLRLFRDPARNAGGVGTSAGPSPSKQQPMVAGLACINCGGVVLESILCSWVVVRVDPVDARPANTRAARVFVAVQRMEV